MIMLISLYLDNMVRERRPGWTRIFIESFHEISEVCCVSIKFFKVFNALVFGTLVHESSFPIAT